MQLGAFDAFTADENQRNAVKKSRFRTFLTAFLLCTKRINPCCLNQQELGLVYSVRILFAESLLRWFLVILIG